MLSFLDLWEAMEKPPLWEVKTANALDEHSLLDSGEESPSMRVIRTGLGFDGDFWESFKSICNDSDGLADLLEVPKEKITAWASKIDELVEKVEKADSEEEGSKDKSEMMPTGEPPAAEPAGNDTYADGPAETRPTP